MKFTAIIGSNQRQLDPLNRAVLLTEVTDEHGNLFRDGHCWVKLPELDAYYEAKDRFYKSLPYRYRKQVMKRHNGTARFRIEFEADLHDYRKGQTLGNIRFISADFRNPVKSK